MVIEIVNMLTDAGGDLRGLTDKIQSSGAWLGRSMAGQGVLVVRATARNRTTIAELASVFAARFPGEGRHWLAALANPGAPMPAEDGFLWTRATTPELFASRLGRR